MKILIIPSWYKTEINLYSGTFVEEQARALQEIGINVSVLYHNHISSFKSFISNPKYTYKVNDNGVLKN